jgi:hypothetical protein
MATRTYASGSFRLMFDKESATLGGFTEAAGLMTTVWTSATLSALDNVLADAINFGRALKSMRILSVAFDGRVVQIREAVHRDSCPAIDDLLTLCRTDVKHRRTGPVR